jgi:LuxR family maltose regulon positive regulatory protein
MVTREEGMCTVTSPRPRGGVGARPRRAPGITFPCLPSKLRPPRPHVALVRRAKLIATLLESTEPLVLVSAPAGAGKTVALTQWVQAQSRPVAWLRLDQRDNDPLLLLRCLATALDRSLGIDPELLELLQRAEPPLVDRFLPGLAETIAAAGPFVLVLDDAQFVQNRESWAHVGLVLEHLAEGAQLVVAGRSEPPLPLARLRASGALLELRFTDLAFCRDEALAMLRLHGMGERDGERPAVTGRRCTGRAPDGGDDPVAPLLEATEGWATGLYLALLAGRGRPRHDWLAEVRGDQHAIADYLLGEVLEQQSSDLQRFLLETSILDELTGPLCAAVTGRADAGAVLVWLARENLFVSAIDDHDERFRYHHLFADLLRARLERLEPDRARQAHRLAAAWLEAHDQPEAAIRHYLFAGDVEATVDLTAVTCDDLLLQGLVESARRLLLLYTEEQLLAHAPLAIAGGWVFALAAGTPEEQCRWTRLMADYTFEDGPTPLEAVSLRSSWLVIVGELAPDGLGQARRIFDECWRLERDSPGQWRRMVKNAVARTYYLSGSPERAAAIYRELLDEPYGVTHGKVDPLDFIDLAGAYAWLALIAQDAGRWDEARDHIAAAERICPRMGLDLTPHLSGWLDMLASHLRQLSHEGDPETMAFARMVDDYMADMVHNAQWVLLVRDVVLGEVALEQGDLAAARAWSDRALKTLAGWSDAGLYGRRAKRLKDALDRLVLAEPITPAEQRVLELLPSYLGNARIGDRLFLSPNTVKAHLRSVYRKLDARSREEAVERARELGLLKR